ncbi:uncharacterized protein IL334_001451 [Kwoniella shivajii]|uniref:F-box domain-containing protein n=1 Tax=Kwoniella shivajii TaxID=564305 RepID=A0ABZ1CTK4_9TREE|nr:hypothetical protein IL334_001451 [Kwoniella shivajii]
MICANDQSVHPTESKTTSSLSFDNLPSDIIHLLFLSFDQLPQSTLSKLVQCSWDFHDRFTPVLYETLNVDKTNVNSVLAGLYAPNQWPSNVQQRSGREGQNRKRRILGYTKRLTINDLPSAEFISQTLLSHPTQTQNHFQAHTPDTNEMTNPYFPELNASLFTSLQTLHLSAKAIMGLAGIYNASSWGSSPFNIPSQPILRALRYNITPKELHLVYPSCLVGLHIHSCIEEVISYLTQGWDLDILYWKELTRSLVGPVPKSRILQYGFSSCMHPTKCSETLKGCPNHYDHVSLTCSTFINHMSTLPFSSMEEAEKGINMQLNGLGCMFSLEWRRVVDEVWSRMGVLDEHDWVEMERWRMANITLTA